MSLAYRRQRRVESTQKRKGGRIALAILGSVLVVMLVAGGAIALQCRSWLKGLPDYHSKTAFAVAQPTKIYAADNTLLASLYLQNRTVLPLAKIPQTAMNATVAVEDERFYKHNGVDLVGIMRSVVSIFKGRREGGSTITQQYIRNTILRKEATQKTLKRKVREAYLALQVEKIYSKDEILGMYLNTVYYGEGAYGIEAAAQTYFSKSASELTLAQTALLAGLPQRPTGLNPVNNPNDALARRNQVLRRMLSNNYITQAQYDEPLAEKVVLNLSKEPERGIYKYPYFVAQVKKELEREFSTETVFTGGLTVKTTLDPKTQNAAQKAVKNAIGKKGPEGALVAIEPSTGQVKAVVGGRNYNKNNFNMATQAHRQAGSSFKTITLAAALKAGVRPLTMINSSAPAEIPTKPTPWIVNNSEGKGYGMMSLASATYASVNTVYARVCWAIGAKKVVDMAHKLGITTELKAYPSITLGAQNVTPLEMATVYATLANGGVYNKPTFITEVTDQNGKELYKYKNQGKRVLNAGIASQVTKILEGVVNHGTGTRASLGAQPVAGKTGTSQRNRDVWFCGYTPQLATAIWVGYPTEKTIYINGGRAYGGTVCAPIFRDFMTAALKGQKVEEFKYAEMPDIKAFKIKNDDVKVPKLTGLTLDEARAKLEGTSIKVIYKDSSKPKGTVLSQRLSGTTIILTVSNGKGDKDKPKIDNETPDTPDTEQPSNPGGSTEGTGTAG